MQSFEERLSATAADRIVSAFQELFESKHLYQHVVVGIDEFGEIIREAADESALRLSDPGSDFSSAANAARHINDLKKFRDSILESVWRFGAEIHSYSGSDPISPFASGLSPLPLPSIRVACSSSRCNGSVQPHNSGYVGLPAEIGSYDLGRVKPTIQLISIPYQCQNCKAEPLVFLVKRVGLKLTLVGRSQFPEVAIPDFIPDKQRKFYRNAVIADQTGFTLAAALYLRTVIEQYFHQTIPEAIVKAIRGHPTGDELAELYAKTLPKAFPDSFPSLKKAYDDLSKIVHSGKEDDETKKSFAAIRSAVDGHFKAVQLFKEMPT